MKDKSIKFNETKYKVLLFDNSNIYFTDNNFICQADINTGSGLYNTGKELYRLASAFKPKPYQAEKNFLLSLIPNKYIGKAYIPSNINNIYIYVIQKHTDTLFHCLLLENNSLSKTTVNEKYFNIEIKLTEFISKIKEFIIFSRDLPPEIVNLLFK